MFRPEQLELSGAMVIVLDFCPEKVESDGCRCGMRKEREYQAINATCKRVSLRQHDVCVTGQRNDKRM